MASGHDHHHIIPLKVYFRVIALLMFLTVITVAAAQVDFGAFNKIIAILIASVKAGFVLAYFMHLKYDDKIYWVALGTSIFFLIVLWFFCWVDFATRFLQQGIVQ
jgi:cytochrome c oxidase subunit IV